MSQASGRLASELAIRPAGSPTGFLYASMNSLVRGIAKTYFRAEIQGREHFPASGPCMILSNHASFLDPPIVGGMLNREMHFLARDGLFRVPILGSLIRGLNSHPIRREGIDRDAIKICAAILEAGWPLLLFPEGTRSPDGEVTSPRGGFGMILERVPDVPCLPVVVRGTHAALGRGKVFPRPAKVRVQAGPTFRIEPRREAEPRREFYDRCAAELGERWRRLGAFDRS